MDKQFDIATRLSHLRAEYAARLPAEIGHLRQLGERAQDPATQTAALTELGQKLHKLAGAAGSFGFPELGKKAKTLELQVQEWLGSSHIDPGVLRIFAVAISALESEVHHNRQAATPALTPVSTGAGSNRVYVVGDAPDMVGDVCLTLRHFGHQVEHFSSLVEAEQEMLRRPPDFIICDSLLTGETRDVIAVITALQAQLSATVPVIFVSDRTDFEAYHAAVRAGAVGYFVKPLDIVRLVDCFENYWDRHRSAPYRVLIIDDDRTLAEHYKLVLGTADIRAEVINDPHAVFAALNEFHPELILLDINMPGCSGIELAQVIRLNQDWLRVPITYLSSEQDEEKRAWAMRRAGDDFLSKPLSNLELITAVSVRAARSRQLSDALDRDSLTGLLKHSRVKEQLDIEVSRAQRTGEALSLVMLDLDYFKKVNDTYGHPAGDKVIKSIAHLLRQRLRKMDTVGRYGGEEFVAVLPRCNAREAQTLIDDIRQRFHKIQFGIEGASFRASFSAGIAALEEHGERADQLLQAADAALYRAKSEGRNRVCISE